jgi:hypothetical protein
VNKSDRKRFYNALIARKEPLTDAQKASQSLPTEMLKHGTRRLEHARKQYRFQVLKRAALKKSYETGKIG